MIATCFHGYGMTFSSQLMHYGHKKDFVGELNAVDSFLLKKN